MKKSAIALLVAIAICFAISYAIRFQLMEQSRWIEVCEASSPPFACILRSAIGKVIHFQILAWAAMALAIPGFLLADRRGRQLACAGLLLSIPALALYTVTPAVFALLIAALRLVRNERPNANTSNSAVTAQPNA